MPSYNRKKVDKAFKQIAKGATFDIKEGATNNYVEKTSTDMICGRFFFLILKEFHINILKKFYEKGDYDVLDVSKNLISPFRELKGLGFLDWKSETKKNDCIILNDFVLTKSAKDLVKSIK